VAAPEVEAVACETAGHALVLKVDTEVHPELVAAVQNIPMLIVFMNEGVVQWQAKVVPRSVRRQ
jgi:hypothetical protein